MKAIISVGSNINPEKNIEKARFIIKTEQRLLKESNFVWTKPKGFVDQPDFINGSFLIETDLELDELKKYLKVIETKLGRVRTTNKNGPRTIDLDVVYFDGRIIDDDYNKYEFVKENVDALLR